MRRGSWPTTAHTVVAKSRTWLKQLSTHAHIVIRSLKIIGAGKNVMENYKIIKSFVPRVSQILPCTVSCSEEVAWCYPNITRQTVYTKSTFTSRSILAPVHYFEFLFRKTNITNIHPSLLVFHLKKFALVLYMCFYKSQVYYLDLFLVLIQCSLLRIHSDLFCLEYSE